MSMTDTRAAFEAAYLSANGFHTKAELANEWKDGMLSSHMFRAGYQAATEAAKATGTAGEQEPWQALDFGDVPFPGHWVASWPVTQQRGYIDGYRAAVKAEAERQPAPALPVKTWRERWQEIFKMLPPVYSVDACTFMQNEIADLRAALAATAAPVLSDEQIADIAFDTMATVNMDANPELLKFARAILAATRSQP